MVGILVLILLVVFAIVKTAIMIYQLSFKRKFYENILKKNWEKFSKADWKKIEEVLKDDISWTNNN